MFDLTSSKLLILAAVALLVVGPKDFPILLRTIGKYMGLVRRQAAEFRAQFDEAMREAELDQMKAEVEKMSRDIEESVREADKAVANDLGSAQREVAAALEAKPTIETQPESLEPESPAPAITLDSTSAAPESRGDEQAVAPPQPARSHS